MEEKQSNPNKQGKIYTVSIKDETGKFSLSGEKVDRDQLSVILQAIYLSQPGILTSQPPASPKSNPGTEKSPREFLEESGAKSYPQKIAAIVGYIKAFLGKMSASVDEVKSELERAGEPVTTNFFRDLKRTVSYGWVAKSQQEADKFYITGKGSKALEEKFPVQEKKVVSGRRSRSSKGHFLTTTIRPEMAKIELESSSATLGKYFSLGTKTERILWLLADAKEKGFENINYKELSYLADKIGDNIPGKSITALIEGYRRKGYIATPLGDSGSRNLKILGDGIEYLKQIKK